MLLLTSTSDKVQLITGAVGASIDVNVSWVDKNADVFTPGRANIAGIATATTTDIVGSPAASTQRNVKAINIINTSAISSQVTIRHTDGTNIADLFSVTLLQGETVEMDENGVFYHRDSQGAEYDPMMPNDYLYATGIANSIAESVPRMLCTENGVNAPTASGTLFMQAIYLRAGVKINNINFFSSATALSVPTNQFFAIYNINRNLVAQTANFTTEAWAANTLKTKALTSTYTVPSSGLYYIGILIVATTPINLKGNAFSASQLSGTAPILHGTSSTGLTTSLPNPAAAITATTACVWCAVS